MNAPVEPTPRRGNWKSLALIVLVVVGGSQGGNWWRNERAAQSIQRQAKAEEITLYTTSTCPYCARARSWLKSHAIAWRECNVETDAACMKAYEARGAPGVPMLHARGQWHLGFDPVWLAQVLGQPAAEATQPSPSLPRSPRP